MEVGANLKKLVVAMVSTNLGMVAVAAIRWSYLGVMPLVWVRF